MSRYMRNVHGRNVAILLYMGQRLLFQIGCRFCDEQARMACLCAYLLDFHIHLVLYFTFSHLFSNPATRLSSSV